MIAKTETLLPAAVMALLLMPWAAGKVHAAPPRQQPLDRTNQGSPSGADLAGNPGKTPPMGWNSWNTFGKQISARLVEEIADAAKRSRLDEVGYKYLVMDDGWQLRELGAQGELVPNPAAFPQGIAPVAQYVRSRGFELGIYSSPNSLSCANFAGSLGHETRHVRQFAEWGCSFVKYDYSPGRNGETGLTRTTIIDRYRAFGDALKAEAPNLRFAICEKGWAGQITTRQRTKDSPPVTAPQRRDAFGWCREVGGAMWRTSGDIRPTWVRIMQILDEQEGLASLAGPGAANDPDMLEVGNGSLTEAENRTHFTLWCVLNDPLILGNDLRRIPEPVLRIITNREVIALNQDLLCRQAEKVVDTGDVEIFAKPLANGDVGVCVLNRAGTLQSVAVAWDQIGLSGGAACRVRDLWKHQNLGPFTDQIKRKKNPVLTLMVSWLLLLSGLFAATAKPGTPDRPNLLIIFGEDWGWGDLSCHGQRPLATSTRGAQDPGDEHAGIIR